MPSKKLSRPEQKRLAWDPVGLTAGVDEAGRGPLAGPVVAAAVILDDSKRIRGLADSKVLTPLVRDRLYDQIREKALCCSIAQASVEEIDELNILHATMLAMKRAVEGLRLKPVKVLVDGNRLPSIDVLAEAVIGGDALIKSISAASILAKVHRDRLCRQLDEEFPHYGFAAHKGYDFCRRMVFRIDPLQHRARQRLGRCSTLQQLWHNEVLAQNIGQAYPRLELLTLHDLP